MATEKRASFRDEEYWGRAVPGFGDPGASVYVLGLARALERGGIHRIDPREFRDPCGHALRLLAPGVGQVQSGRASRQ